MVRRPWGTGAVYRRRSDGRWIGRLSDGHGGHRYVTSADKETVKRRLRELSVSTTGRRRGSTETVSAYLMATLGHANVATTVDLYGGMAAESRQRAAKVMDDVFDGRGTEKNQYQKPL